MSNDWVRDIDRMHQTFSHSGKSKEMDKKTLNSFLKFRVDFLEEELTELKKASKEKDAEEIVDALIDLCVVAIGTLDVFEVDSHRAWNEVLNKNMEKRAGSNSTRPNSFGFPDLVKPEGWSAPSHNGNHGLLEKLK